MKISCTPISFQKSFKARAVNLFDFLELLSAHQCDGVDLLDSHSYPWFFRDFASEHVAVRKKIADCGLQIACYACGNNFARLDADSQRLAVASVIHAIHEAAEMKVSCLRIFGGHHASSGGDPGMTYRRGLELIISGIEACIGEAEKCGVVLALENHGRLPGLSDEILLVLRHFDSAWLRVTFDVANFQPGIQGECEDPMQAYERLKDYIVHCHVKDLSLQFRDGMIYRMPAIAGEGGLVPLRQLAYALERDCFQGYCSLEYEAQDAEEIGVPKSLKYLLEIKEAAALYSQMERRKTE